MAQQSKPLNYYVYGYYDVRDGRVGEVIYIGKGSTRDRSKLKRMGAHWQVGNHRNPFFDSVLKKIKARGLEPVRKVISWHDTEDECFEAEMANIALYKLRREGGTLCNLSLGGEGPNGAIATPEMLAKKSVQSKDMWLDIEFKAKTSAAIKAAKATPEFRAKVSAINKEIWAVDGVREAFSARMKEVLDTPEEKARKSAKAKAMWQDPEFRAKMDAAREKRYALNPPKAKPPKLTKEEVVKKRADGIRAAAARRTPEERARISAGLSERTTAFAAKRKAEQIAAGLRQPDLTPEERAARRSANMKAAWQNLEMRAKHSANLKATLALPEVKAKKSASASAKWDDAAKAAEKSKWTPERRAEQSAKMKAALAKLPPEFKAKKAQEMRDRNADPEYKAKLAAVNKARWENPAEREAQSARMKAAFANPQDKVRRGAATAELWKDPAYREKMANRPTRKTT